MAGKRNKNRTTVNNTEFFTDESGNIKGKVEPSYTYTNPTAESAKTPAGVPSNTPLGQQMTQQASDRAREQVLNEAARSAEDIDKRHELSEAYNKGGVNPSNKQVYNIIDNEREKPVSDGIVKDLGTIASEESGLAGTGEQDLTTEQKDAMQDSMDKRTKEDEIERTVLRDNPGASESEIINETNRQKEALDEEEKKVGAASDSGDPAGSTTPDPDPDPKPDDFDLYKSIYDKYRMPKNGAEYIKQLWGQGFGGKAKAIGNVLGNILGAVGHGMNNEGYTSDWENYANEYQKQMSERNSREYNDNMDLIKQARTNEQSRQDLLNTLNMAKKYGNLSPEELTAIQNFQTATTPSSAADKAIAAILTGLSNNGAFNFGKKNNANAKE